MDENEKTGHMLILNIPRSYGSGDLRRFFTNFVESGRFQCFHYKRRPMQKLQTSITKILSGLDDNKLLPTSLLDGSSLTNCCIIQVNKDGTQDFLTLYQGQQWYGRDEVELDSKCFSIKIDPSMCLDGEIKNCMELRPPTLMPNGNVGTTTQFFMDAISSCRMPSKLIAKLDLEFPQSRTRRYANVPPPNVDHKPPNDDGEISSRRLTLPFNQKKPITVTGTINSNLFEESMHIPLATSKRTKDVDDTSTTEAEQDNYAYLGQEWERHQALNDGMFTIT